MSLLRPMLLCLCLFAAGCASDEVAAGATALPETSDHGEFRVRIEPLDGAFRRGVNDFSVHATDASGAPVTLSAVRARMPLHNHVTDAPAIAADGSEWVVSNLILWMPGRWEITLRMTHGSVYDDTTILTEVP